MNDISTLGGVCSSSMSEAKQSILSRTWKGIKQGLKIG